MGSELDGASADYGGLVVTNAIYAPERNRALEAGVKWELFDRRLLLTGAAFDTYKNYARETVPIPGSKASTVTPTAAYDVRGVDIEAAGKITDDWSVQGGYVLLDTKATQSAIPTNVGLPLANIAHRSFSLLTKYQINPVLEIGGQAVYASKIFGGTFVNNVGTVLPSHWRFDTFLEMQATPTTSFKLYVTNITNETYYDTLYRSSRPSCRSRQADRRRSSPPRSSDVMLVTIPGVLDMAEVAEIRRLIDASDWEDGRSTAGGQSRLVKDNEQLPPDGALARRLGERIVSALTRHPRFIAAATPLRIFPPLFNRYGQGCAFGLHIDNAVRGDPATGLRIRTDLSATLFLSEPQEYDGGDLVIEDQFGAHEVKLPAGDLVLYPASSLHMVTPITRGARVASFFWIQSMIRDEGARSLVFDLDEAIQSLAARLGSGDDDLVRLTGVYPQFDPTLGRALIRVALTSGRRPWHRVPAMSRRPGHGRTAAPSRAPP